MVTLVTTWVPSVTSPSTSSVFWPSEMPSRTRTFMVSSSSRAIRPRTRRQVFESLRAQGLGVNVHYIPVHLQPDSVRKGNFGKIVSRIESEGFRVLGVKKIELSQRQAQAFYGVHRERPFFGSLVEYMTSGPVFVAALERDNAVPHLRSVMGARSGLLRMTSATSRSFHVHRN